MYSFGNAVLTLIIGAKEHELLVHQNLLSENSPYFVALAKKEWKEGREHRVPLPDDDPALTRLYVHWLYRRSVLSRPNAEEVEHTDDELRDAYVFVKMIQDEHFRDAVLDSVICSVDTPGKDGKCWYPSGPTVDRE